MPLWKIAWRSIQRRGLASSLTALSMALGVMLVVGVLLISNVVEDSFKRNASLGYNLIIGADKSGRTQLVLNTVYYLSEPIDNLDYRYFEKFLPASKTHDGNKGAYADYVEWVIPVCLGDYFGEYRVVGTTVDMFDTLIYDLDRNKKYEFREGRNFEHCNAKHGYFEAVVGATVAREKKLKVGDLISPSHGAAEGAKHSQFVVVGILKASGTPNDRAVFVNLEGFLLLDGHSKPPEDEDGNKLERVERFQGVELDDDDPIAHFKLRKTLPLEQREITSMLVRSKSQVVALGLENTINKGKDAQAAFPIGEITRLFGEIITPIQSGLLLLTLLICVVSGISILVSIYNSMSDRRKEIAVMRSLGAGRQTVMTVVLLESVILSVGGGLIGWLAGHAMIAFASGYIEVTSGVIVSPFDMAFGELLLVPFLIILAVVVGFLPALSAYRTDVAKSLSSAP